MPAVYLADVAATAHPIHGTTYAPVVPAGTEFVAIMIDPPRLKAIIATKLEEVVGPGLDRIVSGPTWQELRANGARLTPTKPARTRLNDWLTAGGYTPTTEEGQETWYDIINFVARQVDPAASLDNIRFG